MLRHKKLKPVITDLLAYRNRIMPLLWRKRLFFICLPVLIGLAVWNAHLKTDISTFFVAGDNAEALLLASEMQSGHLSRRYIVSIGYAAPVNGELAAFTRELILAFNDIEGITSVWQPGKQQVVTDAIKQLYRLHGSRMFSLTPEASLTDWLSDDALANRAAHLKQALLSPQGSLIKKVAKQDPLLLSLTGFSSLAQQATTLTPNENYRILILETEASGLEAAVQKAVQANIHTVFESHNQARQQQYQLEMTGVPVFASTIQASVSADITRISLASSLLLTLLFLLVFRSVKAFFWVSLILAAVIASAVWITSLVFGYVHGLTMAVGTTLVGICIDYPVHTLVHASEASPSSRLRVVETLWPSLFLGGLTTVIGYTALGLSGYPGFQQIAVYAGSGIFVALALTRYVLPALMQHQVSPIASGFSVNGWLQVCQQYRRGLLAVLVIVVIAAIASLPRLQWINDLGDLTPELNQLKAQDQRIRARLVSVEPGRFVLITGKDVETALQKAEQVYNILERLKQRDEVDNYFGLYPWILSQQLQNQNQRALQAALSDHQVVNQWQRALATQGLSVARLGQLDYLQQPPLRLSQVLASPVKQLISGQLIIKDEQVLLMVWLAMHQPEAVVAALDGIDNVTYFSQRDMLNQMASSYRQQAVKMLALGLSLIMVLLIVRYKSLLLAIQTLLPAIISALVVLTGWAWSGHALSFLHLVGFLLAVAICVDYGIFYSENRAGNATLTYRAMAVSMLTSAAAFACLGVAESGALQTLGATVALGVILGFLLCPVLIQAGTKH